MYSWKVHHSALITMPSRVVTFIQMSCLNSTRLETCEFNHLRPFLGLSDDQPAIICRRARQDGAAEVGETLLELRFGEACLVLFVEPGDDLWRSILGRPDAINETRFIARHEVTHGWELR